MLDQDIQIIMVCLQMICYINLLIISPKLYVIQYFDSELQGFRKVSFSQCNFQITEQGAEKFENDAKDGEIRHD